MSTKLLRHVVEWTCDWCGDGQEQENQTTPYGWFNLHGPFRLDGSAEMVLLCSLCGMRATSALHEAQTKCSAGNDVGRRRRR